MLNDTAPALFSFRDASLTGTSDAGRVYREGGSVLHRSVRAFWKAAGFTRDGISLPLNAGGSFPRLFTTRDEWKAALPCTDKEKKVARTYLIKRNES